VGGAVRQFGTERSENPLRRLANILILTAVVVRVPRDRLPDLHADDGIGRARRESLETFECDQALGLPRCSVFVG
jgi:hypothetical protein